jgi:putative integral membrane protein (TIGR02587 family)
VNLRGRAPSIGRTLQEYGRGLAGGLLFSLPLLYTREIWRAGGALPPGRLLLGLAGVFVLLLGYNRHAGLRCNASRVEVVIDSVEELGLGLALAAGLLLLLGRVDATMAASEVVGRVIVGGLALAIGFSVGTAQLGGGDDAEAGMQGDGRGDCEPDGGEPDFAGQMALALCGAVLIAANIAPTEEVQELGRGVDVAGLLAMTGLTVGVAALVLHFSGFVGAGAHPRRGWLTGTVATYLAAILASTALLWFFGRLDDVGPSAALAQVVVLGLPTVIGASAGRLLLQQ